VKIVSRGLCKIGVTNISSLHTLGRIYLSTYMDVIAHEQYVQTSLVSSTRVAWLRSTFLLPTDIQDRNFGMNFWVV
jgi:hypothetical protein